MRRKGLPPIQGMPVERAYCVGCGKPLQPVCDVEYGQGLTILARHFKRWDAYHQRWHSLRCALDFASDAYASGWRRPY